MQDTITNGEQLRRAFWQLPAAERETALIALMGDVFAPNDHGQLLRLFEGHNLIVDLQPVAIDFVLALGRRHGGIAPANAQFNRLAVNPNLTFDQVDQLIDLGIPGVLLPMANGTQRIFGDWQLPRILQTFPARGHEVMHWAVKQYQGWAQPLRENYACRWATAGAGSVPSDPSGDLDAVFQLFVGDRHLTETAVQLLWQHTPHRWWQLASHPNLPAACFEEAVGRLSDPSERAFVPNELLLRKAILAHERLDPRLLHLFYADRENWPMLARNPGLTVNMAYLLRAEMNPDIHMGLISNRGLDAAVWGDVLDDLIKNNTSLTNCDIMLAPQITTEQLWKLYRAELSFAPQQIEWFFASPAADAAFRKDVLKSIGRRNFAQEFTADLVRKYPELFDAELLAMAGELVKGNSWQARHARAAIEQRTRELEQVHA